MARKVWSWCDGLLPEELGLEEQRLLLVGGWFPFACYDVMLPRLRMQLCKSPPPDRFLSWVTAVQRHHCLTGDELAGVCQEWGGRARKQVGIRLLLRSACRGPRWVPVYVPTQRFSFLRTDPICRQPSWSAPLRVFIQNKVRRINNFLEKIITLCIVCLNTPGVLGQTCRSFFDIYGIESNKAEEN